MSVFKLKVSTVFQHIIKIGGALYRRTYLLRNGKVTAVHIHESVELEAYARVVVELVHSNGNFYRFCDIILFHKYRLQSKFFIEKFFDLFYV